MADNFGSYRPQAQSVPLSRRHDEDYLNERKILIYSGFHSEKSAFFRTEADMTTVKD